MFNKDAESVLRDIYKLVEDCVETSFDENVSGSSNYGEYEEEGYRVAWNNLGAKIKGIIKENGFSNGE